MISGIILILLMVYTTITPLLAARIKLPGLSGSKEKLTSFSQGFMALFSFERIKGWFKSGSQDSSEVDEDEFKEKYPALSKKKEENRKGR